MHTEILEQTASCVAIKINPKEFKIGLFKGKPDAEAKLAFNLTYSWLGVPIGLIKTPGQTIVSIPLTGQKKNRPCLCLDASKIPTLQYPNTLDSKTQVVIAQAGPTLLLGGAKLPYDEHFREDATRRTTHVAVGITPYNKIVALIMFRASLSDLATKLANLGCTYALKCDGGNASAFWYNDQKTFKLGNGIRGQVGIQFI